MRTSRRFSAAIATSALVAALAVAPPALANHPVTVEGNCFGPGSGATATGLRTSPVEPGTCGDYDGDGLIGVAEDEDMDNNFGTINRGLAAVAQNGTVTIVASGTFPEAVRLTPIEGASVTLEAAPGVRAAVDAVVQGQAGTADRITKTGIFVKTCGVCRATVRNITVRNFARGFAVAGYSRVLLNGVRADGNLHYGILAKSHARMTIQGAVVNASGFRKSADGVAVAKPGIGISISDAARALISNTTISNSRRAGLSADRDAVTLRDVQAFGNNPNFALRS